MIAGYSGPSNQVDWTTFSPGQSISGTQRTLELPICQCEPAEQSAAYGCADLCLVRSLGKTKKFKGDVYSAGSIRRMLKRRAYKNEIIHISGTGDQIQAC
jgi:hypothetical protein